MNELAQVYLGKARQSLAGAESEYANGRYDNCANRCYYAVFQAAIAGLIEAGVQESSGQWSHAFVGSQFVGRLIHRQKRYPAEFRSMLADALALRQRADYDTIRVTDMQALRALRRTRSFVGAVLQGGIKP